MPVEVLLERLIDERVAAAPTRWTQVLEELPVWHPRRRSELCTGGTSITMSIEPGLVDANILVYALDADSPQHAASRALLEAARDAATTLYVTSQVLCEFYSIVTNARRVPRPRSPSDALSVISALLVFLHVLPTPAQLWRAGWICFGGIQWPVATCSTYNSLPRCRRTI